MTTVTMFLPLTKVDAVQRLIYAQAAAEVPDKTNEIFDYDGSKPNFEKWSSEIAKASGGKSKGNVRAMHGKVAAGKLTDIQFNDDRKTIDVVAKIIDDAEWRKVEEGVYTGVSIGGSYEKTWTDEATGLRRYIANPAEISIVDNPCMYGSHFQMVKAAGAVENVQFVGGLEKAVSTDGKDEETKEEGSGVDPKDEDEAKADAEAKAKADAEERGAKEDAASDDEGAEDKPDDEAAEGEAEKADWGIDQVFQVRADGAVFKAKADAKKHVEAMKVLTDPKDPLSAAVAKALATAKAAEEPAPGPVDKAVMDYLEAAAAEKGPAIEAIIDFVKALMPEPEPAPEPEAAPEPQDDGMAEKMAALQAENERLQKSMEAAVPGIETLEKTVARLHEEIEKLKAEPRPMPRPRLITKNEEVSGGQPEVEKAQITPEQIAEVLAKMTPAEQQKLALRAALARPSAVEVRG